MGKQKRCERREFIECPYRREEIDYEHWIHKCGKSFEFARERAIILCNSIPCMFAIELNKQTPPKEGEMDTLDVRFCPIHQYRSVCQKECACYSLRSINSFPPFVYYMKGDEPVFKKRPYCNHLKCFICEGE